MSQVSTYIIPVVQEIQHSSEQHYTGHVSQVSTYTIPVLQEIQHSSEQHSTGHVSQVSTYIIHSGTGDTTFIRTTLYWTCVSGQHLYNTSAAGDTAFIRKTLYWTCVSGQYLYNTQCCRRYSIHQNNTKLDLMSQVSTYIIPVVQEIQHSSEQHYTGHVSQVSTYIIHSGTGDTAFIRTTLYWTCVSGQYFYNTSGTGDTAFIRTTLYWTCVSGQYLYNTQCCRRYNIHQNNTILDMGLRSVLI